MQSVGRICQAPVSGPLFQKETVHLLRKVGTRVPFVLYLSVLQAASVMMYSHTLLFTSGGKFLRAGSTSDSSSCPSVPGTGPCRWPAAADSKNTHPQPLNLVCDDEAGSRAHPPQTPSRQCSAGERAHTGLEHYFETQRPFAHC